MRCIDCGAENPDEELNCVSCGAALGLARVHLYFAGVEANIKNGEYELASAGLEQANQELGALSADSQQRYQLLRVRASWLQGTLHYNQNNMERAEEELQRARTMLEGSAADNALLADVLNKLGCISRHRGQHSAALAYHQRSTELAIEEQAYEIATKAINNMGNIYISQGEINRAIACYNLGLLQAERAGAVALAQAYTTLAWLHSNYGPYKLALEYAAKALALAGAIEDLNTRCLVIDQVGVVYLQHGDLEQAEAYLHEAHALVQRTGNRIVSEEVTSHLAELMQQQGDQSAWLGYAMKAFHAATDRPYLREGTVLQLTAYHIKQGELERAASLIQAFKEAPNGDAESRNLAIVHYAEALLKSAAGNWAEAEHHFQEAIDSGTLTYYELATAWQDYALMLLEQDKAEPNRRIYAKAFTAVEEAISLLRELELPPHPSTGEIKTVYDVVSVSSSK